MLDELLDPFNLKAYRLPARRRARDGSCASLCGGEAAAPRDRNRARPSAHEHRLSMDCTLRPAEMRSASMLDIPLALLSVQSLRYTCPRQLPLQAGARCCATRMLIHMLDDGESFLYLGQRLGVPPRRLDSGVSHVAGHGRYRLRLPAALHGLALCVKSGQW